VPHGSLDASKNADFIICRLQPPLPYHLLRSLTYFEDAEEEPIPEMIKSVTWEEIKQFFRAEAIHLCRK